MITIDKSDGLYKYLTALKVPNIDEEYMTLAKNGRYSRADVRKFWQAGFQPSVTEELDEQELEKVLDYYSDLRKTKPANKTELKALLKEYCKNKEKAVKDKIIVSKLKDLLILAINYRSLHKDVDLADLVQTASMGLMTALDKYDETTKIPFDDYMLFWIRDKITKEFEEKK